MAPIISVRCYIVHVAVMDCRRWQWPPVTCSASAAASAPRSSRSAISSTFGGTTEEMRFRRGGLEASGGSIALVAEGFEGAAIGR